MSNESASGFEALGLPTFLCESLKDIGYEQPSPIQQQSIPVLLQKRDLLGLAQTGTGKTAAFALPILANIDLSVNSPQALILAPTRELAIQVAEAFQTYAKGVKGFHIAPIYGGQDMRAQLRQLKRGVHVVVGTPGRVMDHLRRNSLNLDNLNTVVLDEADEMLRMGFIDDVEWILEHTPKQRQVALFSATMPQAIKKITANYLDNPERIQIEAKTKTVERIEQQYVLVSPNRKIDALTRILEVEDFDGVIMFVRTKTATVDLAQRLEARGYASAALNGDINQKQREITIEQLKSGKIDIVVATDVAARGIDVPRVTHVVNFDIPYDNEAYVHRIGRTGRAGRSGKAILLVTPRERHLLRSIERSTGQPITETRLPTSEELTTRRISQFRESVTKALSNEDLSIFKELIGDVLEQTGESPEAVAAAVAYLAQSDKPLFVEKDQLLDEPIKANRREKRDGKKRDPSIERKTRKQREAERANVPMDCYQVEVGRSHGARPGDLVGAIANEADLPSNYIGNIVIEDSRSFVQLPSGMPKELSQALQKVFVRGRPLKLRKIAPDAMPASRPRPPRSGGNGGGERGERSGRGRPRRQSRANGAS
ncbi:DEAD/DEAH box helicase [Marinibactrum halimedae]|uniref:ATP-dependent RNA helicase DeaD n=1 Tax=Marinibactrum halimedae TaxID=1444977 RepID=A0AA37T8H6_9GAMM|nr:DEAD/DEAH box helicase [Marinibactrum halimedae]MCD9458948.1 DEAD/DEAH box helicase [Marinibactrum halimedae]GLS26923.1 ATP-dependent RNA helicase DeaD [Marinibactrum halimedae]